MRKVLLAISTAIILIGNSYANTTLDWGEQAYNWKGWDCYGGVYGSKHLLEIGYTDYLELSELHRKKWDIKIQDNSNILSKPGVLFLKSVDRPIYADYFLRGTMHTWEWGDYVITIKSDGTGSYYDFTGIANGVNIESSEAYNCSAK